MQRQGRRVGDTTTDFQEYLGVRMGDLGFQVVVFLEMGHLAVNP